VQYVVEFRLLGCDAFVAPVRTDVSEERFAAIIRLERISDLGTTTSFILMTEAIRYFETSVLTRATRRYIPEYGILHSHRRENLRSYIALTGWAL
jgi:hypothetical protein